MSWEQALRRRFIVAGPVAGLVARADGVPAVFWTVRPSGSGLPALVLTMVADPRPQTLDGLQSLRRSTVQVDALAEDRAQCMALREAAIAAVLPAGTFFGATFGRTLIGPVTDRSQHTDTGFVHRDQFDIHVWHD